jgi:hypothetical protein
MQKTAFNAAPGNLLGPEPDSRSFSYVIVL